MLIRLLIEIRFINSIASFPDRGSRKIPCYGCGGKMAE
jgi:hypothetical protein